MERDYIADSERNVVFHVVELAGRLLRRRSARRATAGLTCFCRFAARFASRLATPRARAEHLHRVGADFSGVAVLPLLVLPLARAQAPFNVHLRSFFQVLARDFGESAEEGDPMP